MKHPGEYGFANGAALRYARWTPEDAPPLWWLHLLSLAPSDPARSYLIRHAPGDTPPDWWIDRFAEFTSARPLAVPALIDLMSSPCSARSREFYESLAAFLVERGQLTYRDGGQYDALMRNYDKLIEGRDAKARAGR